MLCRLFLFCEETNSHAISKYPQSKKDCPLCKDLDVCSVSYEVNQSLTHEKYNWNLSRKLNITPDIIENIKILNNSTVAIRLIHPTSSAVWIVQYNKNGVITYKILSGKIKLNCESISKVNYNLRKDFKYESARDIRVEDFEI